MDCSSNTRPLSSVNHLSIDSVSQNYAEGGINNHNDVGNISPAQFNIYDEKQLQQNQHFQYQNQSQSLNQLLQNNQYVSYENPPARPQNAQTYHSNYWNLPVRSQNENTRMYYSQYQDSYSQHGNEVGYSKIDKMNNIGDVEATYINDGRSYQNEEMDKSRTVSLDWKVNNIKLERLSPKDIQNKQEVDKKLDKMNSIDVSDNVSMKSEGQGNADCKSKSSSSAESSDKSDVMCLNSNYSIDTKISQNQMKHVSQAGFESTNYGQMMMQPNANYYSHIRFPNSQNNTHNYLSPNNTPMMPSAVNRPTTVNYPPYMQTSNPVPGYGYPQMSMHQVRAPYNVHTPYVSRSSQSPFSVHQDTYMNGSGPPLYSEGMKESSSDKKDDTNVSIVLGKQETSDSGSTSNKSITARSSKSKNAIKSESHPTTPVSNTIPSPSQTSMSSIIDENDDSVSSLGPNDSNIIHHPVSQYNQHQITPNISQNPSMMYPQPYPPHNTQMQHPIIGSYPGTVGPPLPQSPFAPTNNMVPSRQYHHTSDTHINNSCFQKLLELGSEPERVPWVERYLKFMQENNTPLGAVPTVVKQPLDLFRLYHAVRERGGLLNVVKTKRWKEICHIVNVNASASGAYTLRRNYIKCLLDYECRFDRNGIDPGPILQEIQSLSDKKKKSTSRATGSSSSSTISSGQPSHHNSEFTGNPSTPRPTLPPPPEFNSPHSFPGHNPYNNPFHNGNAPNRTQMHYPQLQRGAYPGSYNGPRIMAGFNSPPSPMHQPVRYDSNMPPNWNKPVPLSQAQWPSPSSSANSSSSHPMQMPVSPGTNSNTISSSSQQSQPFGSLQEHTRRMEYKSNYGGMPPPPPPPPNGQASIRGSVPPNIPTTSQLGLTGSQYHSNMSHCNYTNQTHTSFNQQRPINPQLPPNMMPQNRHMLQSPVSNLPDPMTYHTKSLGGTVSSISASNSIHNMSSPSCHSRSQMDSVRLTQSYQSPFTYSKSSSSSLLKRYDHLFPPNCVEATQPDYGSKKRKYSSKDIIRPFNPSTVTMALKSGLLAEVSWALNHLNIWSRDDAFFERLSLKNMMPLFQALVDVWRNSLGVVFGYDLFIQDLELPINLEVHITRTSVKLILDDVDTLLRRVAIHEREGRGAYQGCDNNDVEARIRAVKEKVVDMLNDGKYLSDRRGLPVKLDMLSKLESVIGGGEADFVHFLRTICASDIDSYNMKELEYKPQTTLAQVWEAGGSDCTFHIMPLMLSQRGHSVHKDWAHRLMEEDHDHLESRPGRGSPQIKRSLSPETAVVSPESSAEEEVPIFQSKTEVCSEGESLFFEVDEADEEKILRCLCASIVIRNLSFLPGNDRIMGTNRTLLVILGRLLLLGHTHDGFQEGFRNQTKSRGRWWLRWVDDVREHVLVTLVNISSYLELDLYPETVVQPIVLGLLHWLTCDSAEAEDALPSHGVLGCRRLALECVMRLCVHDHNIDFIVSASSPQGGGDLIVRQLFDFLAASFCYPEVQVVKEMALAVMHYLSVGGSDSSGLGCMYLARARPSVIGGLISFIEVTESQIRHVVDSMGMEALQARPELMGTSLEFLRHSGALLNRIASHPLNRTFFSRDQEMRMLNLVISTVLDQTVAQSISAVLFLLSGCSSTPSKRRLPSSHEDGDDDADEDLIQGPINKFRSFLTFDDLSFCDKDNGAVILVPTVETSDVVPPSVVCDGVS